MLLLLTKGALLVKREDRGKGPLVGRMYRPLSKCEDPAGGYKQPLVNLRMARQGKSSWNREVVVFKKTSSVLGQG